MNIDYVNYFSQIARRELPPGLDIPMAARYLNEGRGLRAACNEPIEVSIRGLQLHPLPGAEEEPAEELDCTVIVHRDDPLATAHLVELRMTLGERVVLVDLRYGSHADPELITALLGTTVYLGNLAAYDIDQERALYTAMIPVRDGTAFRQFLTHHLLTCWAWQGIIRAEVRRRFGDVIAADSVKRAETQARTRLGGYLVKVQKRGLRCEVVKVGFTDRHLDAFWLQVQPKH
jgi:hypothetical protein